MDTFPRQLEALRRQVRFLWLYAAVISIVLIMMLLLLFINRGDSNRFKELSAEKINIIERDGTVKLSLFNQATLPAGMINGVKLPRSGDVASGLMFYNTEGEECGGLIYSNSVEKGQGRNSASMTFDQYKQDQVVQLVNDWSDANGSSFEKKGLQVNDRPAFPLNNTFHTLDSLQKIYKTDTAAYQAAIQKLGEQGYFGATRLFIGQKEKNTGLFINDSTGMKRLALFVDAGNRPRIVFYDKEGKEVRELGL